MAVSVYLEQVNQRLADDTGSSTVTEMLGSATVFAPTVDRITAWLDVNLAAQGTAETGDVPTELLIPRFPENATWGRLTSILAEASAGTLAATMVESLKELIVLPSPIHRMVTSSVYPAIPGSSLRGLLRAKLAVPESGSLSRTITGSAAEFVRREALDRPLSLVQQIIEGMRSSGAPIEAIELEHEEDPEIMEREALVVTVVLHDVEPEEAYLWRQQLHQRIDRAKQALPEEAQAKLQKQILLLVDLE